jgi:hypothetical protein
MLYSSGNNERGGFDVAMDSLAECDKPATPRLLAPALLPVVHHGRGGLDRTHRAAGRDSIVRALQLHPRFYDKLLDQQVFLVSFRNI